jgi:uncharacterized membrane protein
LLTLFFGLFFINIGIQHFIDPEWFEPIVPSALGEPRFWVFLSGFFEIVFGIMILIKPLRKYGSLGISLMLVVLYWANLNMWINDIPIGGVKLNFSEHIIRGIIQILLILLSLYIGRLPPFAKEN